MFVNALKELGILHLNGAKELAPNRCILPGQYQLFQLLEASTDVARRISAVLITQFRLKYIHISSA
jgi:hypothetical protein